MLNRTMTLLFSGAIGVTMTGCAGTSAVTRAQSPQSLITAWEQYRDGNSCKQCQSGTCQSGTCQRGYDTNTLINLPGHPTHRNSFTYNVPEDLMYPPSPTQAAVYQYPYYTFRGPTDFFME